nr:hypothetical protein [Tanacetum cinerariifolium]
MFKLDLDPLAPKLLQNMEAHIDYLKYTQEQADILWGIVKQAKAKQPLDNALGFSCCLDFSLVSRHRMFKTYDREPLSAHELLVPNTISQQPCIPQKRDDWDNLLQPMFDEYFTPPSIVVSSVPFAVAPRAVDLADYHVSTSIDQDASSTKPKNFKQAMTEPSWIDAMQEEIHEFERLQVWEL